MASQVRANLKSFHLSVPSLQVELTPFPRPCPCLLRVVAVHWKEEVFLSRVRFSVWLPNFQPQVTPFLQQARHRRKQGIPSFPPSSHLAGTYSSLEKVMWLQWLVARPYRRPLRLKVRKGELQCSLEHLPMAPASLRYMSSSNSSNLVVTGRSIYCINGTILELSSPPVWFDHQEILHP